MFSVAVTMAIATSVTFVAFTFITMVAIVITIITAAVVAFPMVFVLSIAAIANDGLPVTAFVISILGTVNGCISPWPWFVYYYLITII